MAHKEEGLADAPRIVAANEYQKNLGMRVLHGSMLQFGGRFLFRGLKFIRTIIVARLLFPEDVGLFALAGLCLGFVDTFIQTGLQSAIVEKDEVERRHMDGVWTVHIVKGLTLTLVAFFVAPYAAAFFDEPRLTDVLRVLSIILALDGFVNVGAVVFSKNFQFGRKLLYDFTYTAAEIIAVVLAAIFIPSVWALVIGSLASQVASLIFSYVLSPYRPKLTLELSGVRELFVFGKWVSLTAIFTFFISKADGIVISKIFSVEELGYYQLAFSLAMLPTLEVVRALGSVLFPLFTRYKDRREELSKNFIRIAQIVTALVLPMLIGILSMGGLIVKLFYGERWLTLVPVLSILVFYGALKMVEYLFTPVLLGIGKARVLTYATFLHGAVLAASLVPFALRFGERGVAFGMVGAALASTAYLGFYFHTAVHITIRQFLSIFYIPMSASAAMYFFVIHIEHLASISIFIPMILGALSYLAVGYVLDSLGKRQLRLSFLWIRDNLRK